jgi:hypothetical protein
MTFTEAQDLFALFFAIYFALIIDRSHEMYRPWDTYKAWRGDPHNIKRLLLAWIILFITPLLHFSILFALLGSVNIRFSLTLQIVSGLVLISLGSFFDFGYYRIYEAFLHSYPKSLFSSDEMTKLMPSGKIRPDFWAHFIPGTLYVTVSTMMILLSIWLLA